MGEGSCSKEAEKAAWPALICCEIKKKKAHEQELNETVIQAKVYEFLPSLFR